MTEDGSKAICFFSGLPCRECTLYRGRHYFMCHPGASWESVNIASGSPEDGPWHEVMFREVSAGGLTAADLLSMADRIDLDFWPEGGAWKPCLDPAERKPHFAIDVWNGEAELKLMTPSEADPHSWVARRLQVDQPLEMLRDAVLEQGGNLLLASAYPMTPAIRDWVSKTVFNRFRNFEDPTSR